MQCPTPYPDVNDLLAALLQGAIRRHDPAQSQHPALGVDGTFGISEHRSEWVIQRYIIRENGITLTGPNPATLIDPVSPDNLRQAVHRLLEEWWLPAAHWAMQNLAPRWSALIDQALNWRRNTELNRLGETLNFIRYTTTHR